LVQPLEDAASAGKRAQGFGASVPRREGTGHGEHECRADTGRGVMISIVVPTLNERARITAL
ncbi:MAG: hypothetical protein Q4A13_10935, partial [Fretibacterium sp.]|nr:hypothetical protein [Fretibacterium sp.]